MSGLHLLSSLLADFGSPRQWMDQYLTVGTEGLSYLTTLDQQSNTGRIK